MERYGLAGPLCFVVIKKCSTVWLAVFCWLLPALLSHAQIPSPAPAAIPSAPTRHRAQVSDPAVAGKLAAAGARRIGDYGGFQFFDVDQAAATALAGRIQLRDEYNVIKLNAAPLDTSLPQTQALRKPAAPFAGKQMRLVHFAGPVMPAWRDSLLATGVEIVSYIPQNAYLVYGGAAAVARLQTLASNAPHVQWEGPYLDDYKIHPAAKEVDAKGMKRQIGTELFCIQMMADAEANAKTLRLLDSLKLEPFRRKYSILHYVNVTGRFAPADLARIAAQPDVVSIMPDFPPKKLDERQDQIVAGNLSGNGPGGPGYLAWLESKGFTQAQFEASGFAVDLSDSGIDDGTTTPNHFGLYRNGQTNNGSRVIYNRLEGTPNPGSTLSGCDGHGTLNSHIVGGYDDLAGFPFEDSAGYHYGLGVCPFVRLGSSVIFDPDNSTYPDVSSLESAAWQSGARINNNSWGDTGSDGQYNSDSQSYDALVRNAESSTAANHEMVIVFAAGNDGNNGRRTVTAPATAKNVIAVGAAQNVQSLGGADKCGWNDSYSANANQVFSDSSRGPCDDGRHKPDLMAPGTRISGGVAQAKDPAATGTADSCFLADAGAICGGVGTNGGVNLFFPDGQQLYTTSTGTSHATPAVSGGCALLRQYFINRGWTPPSAAMTKAFLMNSARYMTGSGANDTLWSDNQGMGEMDLGMAFDGAPRLLHDELSAELFTASGQTRTYSGTVANTNLPFRVTLAWTDAPGSTTSSAANNDLDLTVAIGGVTYLGNVFSKAFSVSGGSADTLDNVESVFLRAGVSGNFTITVTAANINSVGVPNRANALEQDFALVAYNTASIQIASATLAAESCQPTNGVIDPGETVTVNFALVNQGTINTTNLTATLSASGGITAPCGLQTYGVLTGGGPAVSMPFYFTASGSCGSTVTASLALQDGAASLGTVTYIFQLGQLTSNGTYTCCTGAALTRPEILSPTAGFQTTSASIMVDGLAVPGLPLTLYVNGTEVGSLAAATELYSFTAALSYGTNLLTAVQLRNGTNIPGVPVSIVLTPIPPTLTFPANSAPSVTFTEQGLAYTAVLLFDNTSNGAALIASFTNNAAGNYSGTVTLSNGSHSLTAAQTTNGTTSPASATATVNVLTVPPPVILSPVSGFVSSFPLVTVNGTGIAGAPLAIYDGANLLSGIVVNQDGNFTNTVRLTPGVQSLTAMQSELGVTSAPSAPVIISWIVPPPVILAPTNGLSTTNPTVTVAGTGMAGAKVTLYDGSVSNSTITVSNTGHFSATLKLGNGFHILAAVQTANGLSSLSSTPVQVTMTLAPFMVVQPRSQSMFLKGSVTFAAAASGAAPLHYSWYKDSVKVAGAGGPSLTVGNITAASAGSYLMVATNIYGQVGSDPVTLTLIPNPFTNHVGNYYGLFSETPAQFRSTGLFTLTLSSSGLGAYSGNIRSAGGSYGFSGVFSPEGQSAANVPRAGKTPLSLSLSLDVSNGTRQILGTVADGSWVAALEADQAIYSATNRSPWRGTNTILFDSSGVGIAGPGGDGYGKVIVTPAGMASLTGRLSDNTPVAPSAAGVSLYARWPLYIPLYGTGTLGSLSGWITFTNLPGLSLEGSAAWFRTNSSGKLYPHGFTNAVSITGSTFASGSSKAPILGGATNFQITLSGGNLPSPLTNNATLTPAGKFVTNGPGISKLTLSVVPGTGILTGSFLDPATGLTTPISGALMQQQTNAAGYFLSTNAAGQFQLTRP